MAVRGFGRRAVWVASAVGLIGLAVAVVAVPFVDTLAAVGTANKAKLLCSAHFVAGRDPAEIQLGEIGTEQLALVDDEVTRDGRVTASLLWQEAEVVHRPGLGCTRLVGPDAAALRAQPAAVVPPAADASTRAWPFGDRIDPAAAPEFDRARLDAVVDDAFAEAEPQGRSIGTRAVVVVWQGELIAERYAEPFDATTPLIGWSMTKSITNALVGVRVGEGALELGAPAPVPEWRTPGDPRAAITLDQLLRMQSGLEFGERYDDLSSDVITMLFGDGGANMGRFAAAQPLAHPPDTHWSYSSGTTNIIQRILKGTFEHAGAYQRWAQERLLQRIGMTRTTLEPDVSGTFVGSSFGYAPARDWARFGLLFLNDGVFAGERVLPEGWVRYSTTPTPDAPQGQYGAHWWLNVGAPDDPADRPFPQLPTDAYRASGFEGQSVMVVPSADLVVVRLGYTPDESAWSIGDFTADVIAALGAGRAGAGDPARSARTAKR